VFWYYIVVVLIYPATVTSYLKYGFLRLVRIVELPPK